MYNFNFLSCANLVQYILNIYRNPQTGLQNHLPDTTVGIWHPAYEDKINKNDVDTFYTLVYNPELPILWDILQLETTLMHYQIT